MIRAFGPALTLLLVLLLSETAFAQTKPSPVPSPTPSATPNPIGPALGPNDPCTSISAIATRPTQTNSVCTIRPDHVEVEMGYINTTNTGAGNTVAYPQTLVRVGTKVPALELQVAPPEIIRSGVGGPPTTTGTTDAGAGLKYVFGYTPKFNWGGQAFFTAPTGTNGVSNNGTTSTYALNAAYAISPAFSVGTTLATASLTNGPQRWNSFVPSFVVTASLPNSNGIYAEIATFSNAVGPATPTRTQYIYGFYHDIGPRVQVDAYGNFSPTVATGKYHSVGVGVSMYF